MADDRKPERKRGNANGKRRTPRFDQELIGAKDHGTTVAMVLSTGEEFHCHVVYVDPYFVKIGQNGKPDQPGHVDRWINKAHIVSASIH